MTSCEARGWGVDRLPASLARPRDPSRAFLVAGPATELGRRFGKRRGFDFKVFPTASALASHARSSALVGTVKPGRLYLRWEKLITDATSGAHQGDFRHAEHLQVPSPRSRQVRTALGHCFAFIADPFGVLAGSTLLHSQAEAVGSVALGVGDAQVDGGGTGHERPTRTQPMAGERVMI